MVPEDSSEEGDSGDDAGHKDSWREFWNPERDDAELIGLIGEAVRDLLGARVSVLQVYSVPDTWTRIVRRHGSQLDIPVARGLLPSILHNPKVVYVTATKPRSIVFVGEYDELHDLVVAIKSIYEKGELWLSTMHKIQNDRIGDSMTGIVILYQRPK